MNTTTITQDFVDGNITTEELADAYNLTIDEVIQLEREHTQLLNDADISPEYYHKWCDEIDEYNGTRTV